MIEKLQNLDKLTRDEVYSALYALFDNAGSIKVYRHLQDYSGNYSDAFNYYSTFNTRALEQEMCDFFMDNVELDEHKEIEHTYFIKFPISTFIKFESLKVAVLKELNQKCFITDIELTSDFVVFDNGAAVILDFTNEGALIGGGITTAPADVKLMLSEYERIKVNAKGFLDLVKPEETICKNILKQIKEFKTQLKIK